MKKVLVSGIKPTGEIHFGNYFGAMKQNIDMANSADFEAYIFVANYHALTTSNNNLMAEELREDVYRMVASYIALGFDPAKANLFLQSSVPAHTELSTVFNNLVSMPYMMRAHAFKDHEAKSKDVNVGLFTYPILMAADILIYDADIVPVGADQKQHIEYARDIAGYFNRAYQKEYFKPPEDFILESVAIVPGIDGNKMSKSKNNHIPVFCDEEEIKKRVMSIVTDSLKSADKKDPDTNNVYNIHKHFLNKEEDEILRNKFLNASPETPYGHAESKKDLIETILKFRKGKYEKYLELMNDKEKLKEILEMGAKNARLVADKTIKEVRNIVGLEL